MAALARRRGSGEPSTAASSAAASRRWGAQLMEGKQQQARGDQSRAPQSAGGPRAGGGCPPPPSQGRTWTLKRERFTDDGVKVKVRRAALWFQHTDVMLESLFKGAVRQINPRLTPTPAERSRGYGSGPGKLFLDLRLFRRPSKTSR